MAEVVWNVALDQAQEAIAERLLQVPPSVAAASPELLRQRELCGLEVIAAVRRLRTFVDLSRGGG